MENLLKYLVFMKYANSTQNNYEDDFFKIFSLFNIFVLFLLNLWRFFLIKKPRIV